MRASNTPQQLSLCFKNTPTCPSNICRISLSDPADTDPVLGVSGSPLQTLLQLRTEAARPAELLHHPAGVLELLGGQQRLQDPQVALQGLRQRGHRLGWHGGEEAHLLPRGNLEGGVRRSRISAGLSETCLSMRCKLPRRHHGVKL